MKHKVIIADDKPLIRKSLAQTIHWEALGCEVAGEAENGLEAVELIEKICPDLLISDIKMPGMDGLELTEYAKKIQPDIKVLMITGYQEFEYAQRALSLGVSDLVLKPIRNDMMEKKIKKVMEELEKNRAITNAALVSRRARQEQLLHGLIKERVPMDRDFEEKVRELELYGRDYFLILSRVRTGDDSIKNEVRNRVIQWIEDQKNTWSWLVFDWFLGKNQVIILLEEKKRSARERKIHVKQTLLALNERLRNEFGVACYFTVSRSGNDIRVLRECYQDALEIMENCYFTAEQSILFADSYTAEAAVKISSLLRNLECFYQNIGLMDKQELKKNSEEILNRILAESQGDEFRIKCFLSEIGITLLHRCGKEDTNELMDEIAGLEGWEQCCEFLCRFFLKIQREMQEDKEETNPLIGAGLEYIKVHYRENFSLTDLAEKISVNPSYLSRLFKKETGKNFSEILTEYRINRAEYLLLQPGSRVVEVGEQVGYSDYTYFYQVFKRIKGISPSEYKKRVKKTNEL